MMEATISGLHRLLKRVDYTMQEVNCSLRKVLGGRNEGFSGDSLQTSVYCRFFANFSLPSSMTTYSRPYFCLLTRRYLHTYIYIHVHMYYTLLLLPAQQILFVLGCLWMLRSNIKEDKNMQNRIFLVVTRRPSCIRHDTCSGISFTERNANNQLCSTGCFRHGIVVCF